MMPMVSVVVSVYNTGAYLEKCLISIMNQSLKDIEIICVDDGSTDNSVRLLEEYAVKDNRIVIIKHSDNQGLLRTRADGVAASSGKYIIFSDSDDSIQQDACERLSSLMEEGGYDIIQFGTNVIPHDNVDPSLTSHYINYLRPCRRKMTGNQIFEYQFGGMANWHLWNKIYKADLCKKAYETAKKQYMIVSDDLYISFYLTYFAKKMRGVSGKYYNYNLGRGYTNSANSIINQIRTISSNSWFILDCMDFLKKEGTYDKYRKYCFREPLLQLGACISLMKSIDDEEIREKAREIIIESWSYEPFADLLHKMMEDDGWNSTVNRMRRHIRDFGLIHTIRMAFHMISFNMRKRITQLFI